MTTEREAAHQLGIDLTTFRAAVNAVDSNSPLPDGINPEYWWRGAPEDCVMSGGVVDRMLNRGSAGSRADFVQTSTARAPLATNSKGISYLALDGVNDFYQASNAAEWAFFLTGFTLAIVVERIAAPGTTETLLDTAGNTSTGAGLALSWSTGGVQAPTQGPAAFLANGQSGNWLARTSNFAPFTGVELWTVVYRGKNGAPNAGQANQDLVLRRNGAQVSTGGRATPAADTAAPGILTLGRALTGGATGVSRIYEIVIIKRPLPERMIRGLEEAAREKYQLDI